MRNPETSLKKARNKPEKLRKNKKTAASSRDRTEEPWVEIRRYNPYTIWDLEYADKKDNISVDSRSHDSKGNCGHSLGKSLTVKIGISLQ